MASIHNPLELRSSRNWDEMTTIPIAINLQSRSFMTIASSSLHEKVSYTHWVSFLSYRFLEYFIIHTGTIFLEICPLSSFLIKLDVSEAGYVFGKS